MDRSLDEFAEARGEEEGADPDPSDDGVEPTDDGAAPTDDGDGTTEDGDGATDDDGRSLTVRPAESTMGWTPGGAVCAACGRSVERRWRDDGRLVCPDCKEW
jgi:hypothetical protein